MVDWNNPKSLGHAIAQTGMSVGAFADHAGVSRAQIYRLLGGKFKPQFATASRIESALKALHAQRRAAA